MPPRERRPLELLLADIEEAAKAAGDIVSRGKATWDDDRLLRLAAEAVIGRIGDAVGRLPDSVKESIPEVPWEKIRDIRILVDHIYHRINYEGLWVTLRDDVPSLYEALRRWKPGT